MGSCFSKCSRKRKRQDLETPNLVEDKLVIAQAPILPVSFSSTKQPLSPASTSSSVSSFSCSNANLSTTSYSFTSPSSPSSCSISKERSFSNEFLKSCVKENPHIIHNHVKPSFASTPNKKFRASPTSASDFPLAQQKSFMRREFERPSSPHSLSRSGLKSPSPSRRFLGTLKGNIGKYPRLDKSIIANPSVPLVKMENLKLRSMSPRHNSARDGPYLTSRERCTYRISSNIDELIEDGEILACTKDQDGCNIPMEDIDNPLISLDCFIFL